MTNPTLVARWLDPEGLPRAWASGPPECEDDILWHSRQMLRDYLADGRPSRTIYSIDDYTCILEEVVNQEQES